MKSPFKKPKFLSVLVLVLALGLPSVSFADCQHWALFCYDTFFDLAAALSTVTNAISSHLQDFINDLVNFALNDVEIIVQTIVDYPQRFAQYSTETENVRSLMYTYATTTTPVEHNIEITKTLQDLQQKLQSIGQDPNSVIRLGTGNYAFSLDNTDCSTGTPKFKEFPKGYDATDFNAELKEFSIHVNITPVSCVTNSNSGAQTYDAINANNNCLQQQSNLATFIPQAAKNYTDNEIVCFPVKSTHIPATLNQYRQLSQNILILINQTQAEQQAVATAQALVNQYSQSNTSTAAKNARAALQTAQANLLLKSQMGIELASTIFMVTNVTDNILNEMETLALGAISIVNNAQQIFVNFTSMIVQSQNILLGNKKSPQ